MSRLKENASWGVLLLCTGFMIGAAGCQRDAARSTSPRPDAAPGPSSTGATAEGENRADSGDTARTAAAPPVLPPEPAAKTVDPPPADALPAASNSSDAGPASLPTPDAAVVIERFIQACGGREALGRLRNRVINGTYEMAGQKGHMTIYEAEPNQAYVFTLWENGTSSEVWTDGNVIWDRGSNGATKIRQGADRDEHLFRTRFNRELHWQELHKSAEMLGVEEVEGQRYYKVRVEPLVGQAETWYLNEQTGLHDRSESTDHRIQPKQTFEVPVVTLFSDYREVDGVRRYHRLEQIYGFSKMLVTFQTMQHNVEMDSTLFELPVEIQNMLDQGQTMAIVESGRLRLKPGDPRFEPPSAMAPSEGDSQQPETSDGKSD